MYRLAPIESVWHQMKWAVRSSRRNAWITSAIVVIVALGIGANTTIFSFVNGLLLKPLPFRDVDRLVRVWESNPTRDLLESAVSAPTFKDWQRDQTSFEQLGALQLATFNLTSSNDPERIAA